MVYVGQREHWPGCSGSRCVERLGIIFGQVSLILPAINQTWNKRKRERSDSLSGGYRTYQILMCTQIA